MNTQEEKSLASHISPESIIEMNRDLVQLHQQVNDLGKHNDALYKSFGEMQERADAYCRENADLIKANSSLREDVTFTHDEVERWRNYYNRLSAIAESRAKEVRALRIDLFELRNKSSYLSTRGEYGNELDKEGLPIYVFSLDGTRYKVKERTEEVNRQKLDTIKAVRAILGVGLLEAKDIVEGNASMMLAQKTCNELHATIWDMGYFLQMQ